MLFRAPDPVPLKAPTIWVERISTNKRARNSSIAYGGEPINSLLGMVLAYSRAAFLGDRSKGCPSIYPLAIGQRTTGVRSAEHHHQLLNPVDGIDPLAGLHLPAGYRDHH